MTFIKNIIQLFSVMTLFLVLLLVSLMSSAYAVKKEQKFFPGCKEIGYGFQEGTLVLQPELAEDATQTIYFLHNVSNEPIKLEYDRANGNPLYPLWETSLNTDRWSSFATDKENLTFKCISSRGGHDLDCNDALEVCQFTRTKFAEHNKGNYWIPSNKSKFGSRSDAIHYGILLYW